MCDKPVFSVTSGTLPWTKSCFVCGEANPHGLRLRSRVEGDRVVLDYTPRPADLGWRHLVHGGILMTLLDEVMTWAAMLALGEAVVAAEMTTRLKKPVHEGMPIRVEGSVTGFKRRLVLTSGRILDADGNRLGHATGKYLPMPGGGYRLCEDDFVTAPDALRPADILPRAYEKDEAAE